MKTLLILRHAKSSWEDAGLKDHDRPLNPRGVRDAPRMGRLIVELDLVPDLILSSTAVRARSTAELVAEELEPTPEIEDVRALYFAAADDYLEVLREHAGDAERVMVVGHNPSLTTLVTRLTNALERMPTAALAHVELDIDDWAELDKDTPGELIDVWRPKELEDRKELDD